jgi:predicted transcriptional regulator
MDSVYARGGVTSNEDVLRNFCTNSSEVKANNLSTHYNSSDDEVLLRQYGVLIATRKGDKLMITSKRYSVTTSKVQNELLRIAMEYGLDVQKTNEFAKGGMSRKCEVGDNVFVKSKGLSGLVSRVNGENCYVKFGGNLSKHDGTYNINDLNIEESSLFMDEYAKGGKVQHHKLPMSLKNKLKSANNILKKYGGREITEHEATMWNVFHNATSGFEAGYEAFDVAGAKNYHNATTREHEAIGDNLIDISRAITGVDYDDYNFRGTKEENENYYIMNYKNKNYAKGGEIDYYENLAVYVQGKGQIFQGTSMKQAIEKARMYLKKNPNFEVVIVDEKYGDVYDTDGNYINEYAQGGDIAQGNYEMMLSQAKEVEHHVEELQSILKGEKDIDAWVVAKMENVSSTLSDITHYLDGKTEYAKGGNVKSLNDGLEVYAENDLQLKVIQDIIPILDKKGIKLRFAVKVGKLPQSIIFDNHYRDSALVIPGKGYESEYLPVWYDNEFQDANEFENLETNPAPYLPNLDDTEEYAKGGMVGSYSVVLEADDIKNSSFLNYLKRNGIKHEILSVQYQTAEVKFIGSKEALTKMIDKFWVDMEESEMQEMYDSIQKNEYAKGGQTKMADRLPTYEIDLIYSDKSSSNANAYYDSSEDIRDYLAKIISEKEFDKFESMGYDFNVIFGVEMSTTFETKIYIPRDEKIKEKLVTFILGTIKPQYNVKFRMVTKPSSDINVNKHAKGGNINSKTNKKMATKKVKDGQAAPQTKRWIFAFNKGGYNYYNTKEVPYKKPVDSEKKGAPVGYRFSKFAEEKGITNNRFRKPTKSEVEQYAGKKKNGKLIMYRETRSNKSDVNPKKRI